MSAEATGTGREALADVVLRSLRTAWRENYSAQTVADRIAADLSDWLTAVVAEAWDEGWDAHGDHVLARRRWNDTEGAETPPALDTRNPYRDRADRAGGA